MVFKEFPGIYYDRQAKFNKKRAKIRKSLIQGMMENSCRKGC